MTQQQTEKLVIYLHNPPGQDSAFWTYSAKYKQAPAPAKGNTKSGYGYAMPTTWKVLFNGRWYRVKCSQHSNAGSHYIGKRGAWIARVQFVYEVA